MMVVFRLKSCVEVISLLQKGALHALITLLADRDTIVKYLLISTHSVESKRESDVERLHFRLA